MCRRVELRRRDDEDSEVDGDEKGGLVVEATVGWMGEERQDWRRGIARSSGVSNALTECGLQYRSNGPRPN